MSALQPTSSGAKHLTDLSLIVNNSWRLCQQTEADARNPRGISEPLNIFLNLFTSIASGLDETF